MAASFLAFLAAFLFFLAAFLAAFFSAFVTFAVSLGAAVPASCATAAIYRVIAIANNSVSSFFISLFSLDFREPRTLHCLALPSQAIVLSDTNHIAGGKLLLVAKKMPLPSNIGDHCALVSAHLRGKCNSYNDLSHLYCSETPSSDGGLRRVRWGSR